jgi:DNA-directed RNA polymerase subunit E'/Rpb7
VNDKLRFFYRNRHRLVLSFIAVKGKNMFGIHMITDIIEIPASDLVYQQCKISKKNNLSSLSMIPILHREIDKIYPNRVLINVGLLIGRYYYSQQQIGGETDDLNMDNDTDNVPLNEESCHRKRVPKSRNYGQTTKLIQVGGVCDGSSVHYTVTFPMIVFRPYVGEILVGTILDADATGIIVSLGFLATIFVPANYMLQPSAFVVSSPTKGVWVWTPTYDDDDVDHTNVDTKHEPLRYEMNNGAEIRVRVKSIYYSPVTSTAKGKPNAVINATSDNTTGSIKHIRKESMLQATHRQRSNSASAYNDSVKSLSSHSDPNTAMYIIASICEDGLGLTSWWTNVDEDEEDHEERPE